MTVPLAVFLLLLVGQTNSLDCSQPGWSSATHICFRIVHFPKDFWSAKEFCKANRGLLLQLEYVNEVLDALGETMWGNAGEYRLDGWANGTWYHKDNEVLESSGQDSQGGNMEILGSFSDKTLTVDLQTGMVEASADAARRMGFICQGDGAPPPCDKEEEEEEGEEEQPPQQNQ